MQDHGTFKEVTSLSTWSPKDVAYLSHLPAPELYGQGTR